MMSSPASMGARDADTAATDADREDQAIGVLFVCMGNICRSPTAEAVFRRLCEHAGLVGRVHIDSAGTHGYEGGPPDDRAIEAARKRGYDLVSIRSRALVASDFERFDYVLGMDHYNLQVIRRMRPTEYGGHVGRFLDFAPHLGLRDIEDPYHGGARHFDLVLDQIEAAANGLLNEIRRRIASPREGGDARADSR